MDFKELFIKSSKIGWVKAKHKSENRIVYVYLNHLDYWQDKENNYYTEKALDFPNTKIN